MNPDSHPDSRKSAGVGVDAEGRCPAFKEVTKNAKIYCPGSIFQAPVQRDIRIPNLEREMAFLGEKAEEKHILSSLPGT